MELPGPPPQGMVRALGGLPVSPPQSHESEIVSLGCPSAAWAPPLSLSLLLWIVGEVPATRDTGWLCQDGGASEPTGGGPLKAAAVAPEPAAERLGEETDASSSMEPGSFGRGAAVRTTSGQHKTIK